MEPPSGEFRIVSQSHVLNLNPDGTVTPGYNISVTDLQSGVNFPVFVADRDYNADNVRTQILFQLQHIRAVHALSE